MNEEYIYTILIEPTDDDERGFVVSVPALPGCLTQGETYEEAIGSAREAIQCHIEGLLKDGQPVPHETKIRLPVALPLRVERVTLPA